MKTETTPDKPKLELNARSVFTIPALVGTRQEIPDSEVKGLTFRIGPKTEQDPDGIRTWSVRYRAKTGEHRRYTIPKGFPTVGLKKARKQARLIIGEISGGSDPVHQKRVEVAAAADADKNTIRVLAKTFLDQHCKVEKRQSSWEGDERYLNVEVLPAWGDRKVTAITRKDVTTLIQGIADRGSPISANRCLAVIKTMFNFAIKKNWDLVGNPAALQIKPGKERDRERVLSEEEIRLVWKLAETERPTMCALQRLRLVTSQRGGELAKLKW